MALIYTDAQQVTAEKITEFTVHGDGQVDIRTKRGYVVSNVFHPMDKSHTSYRVLDDQSPVKATETFLGDGAETSVGLRNPIELTGSVVVKVDSVTLEETTDYSVSAGSGTWLGSTPGSITFVSAPADGALIQVDYYRPQTAWFTDALSMTLSELGTKYTSATTLREALGSMLYEILIKQSRMTGDPQVGV